MQKETWDAKHTMNLVVFLAALTAVVLLEVFAAGAHVEAVIAFSAGLLVPGSPLSTVIGQSAAKGAGAILVGFGVTTAVLHGCGGQVSEGTRSVYAIAAGLCVAREQAIVDNPCGELDEAACRARDYADLAAERERCDAELAGIEARDSHDGGT